MGSLKKLMYITIQRYKPLYVGTALGELSIMLPR